MHKYFHTALFENAEFVIFPKSDEDNLAQNSILNDLLFTLCFMFCFEGYKNGESCNKAEYSFI